MAKYTVLMRLDCRVDVDVEADSFDEVFKKVESETYDWFNVEVVGGQAGLRDRRKRTHGGLQWMRLLR